MDSRERDIFSRPTGFTGDGPGGSGSSGIYAASWAVVVGIDRYRHLPPLECAVADARAMAELLPKLGFENVLTLFDEQATAEEIRYTLDDYLRTKTDPGDRVLVFYAGHGLDRDLPGGGKEGYIAPVEGRADRIGATCIRMSVIHDWSKAIPAKHVLYLMDCCYSGLAAATTRRVSYQVPDYLAHVGRLPVRHIITAGKSGERSIEEAGHGLFTRKLIEGLEGAADLEQRGYVTGDMLGVWLKERVFNLSRGRQTPDSKQFDGEGEFVFLLGPLRPAARPEDVGKGVERLAAEARALLAAEDLAGVREKAEGLAALGPKGAAEAEQFFAELQRRAERDCQRAREALDSGEADRARTLVEHAAAAEPALPEVALLRRQIEQAPGVYALEREIAGHLKSQAYGEARAAADRLAGLGDFGGRRAERVRDRLAAIQKDLVASAQRALKAQEAAKAADAARGALAISPEDPRIEELLRRAEVLGEARTLRGRLEGLIKEGRYQHVPEVLDQLRKCEPYGSQFAKAFEVQLRGEADKLADEAEGFIRARRWREARDRCQRALMILPDFPDARELLAIVQRETAHDQRWHSQIRQIAMWTAIGGGTLVFILLLWVLARGCVGSRQGLAPEPEQGVEPTPAPRVRTPPGSQRATLRVQSTPVGASVTVDGQPVGTTPVTVEVQAGRRAVRVEKEGFLSETASVVAEPGRTNGVIFTLKAPYQPRTTGKVLQVTAGKVSVDLGQRDRVRVGTTFTVELSARPIVFSGKVIGHEEVDLRVIRVEDQTSEAERINANAALPATGDRVRVKSLTGL